MNVVESAEQIKVILLVGGLGTRLRSVVPSTPKPLALLGDRPFLELLIRQLSNQGLRRAVLCTGYRAQEIERQLGDGRTWDMKIEYSAEPHPLGTAGAVKFTEPLVQGASDFLVMNGDSFMEIDFRQLIDFHRKKRGIATIALVRIKNEGRYGTVQIGSSDRVKGFIEKTNTDSTGLINAGIYVFSRDIFQHIPEGQVSLEKDVFPNLLDYGIYGLEQHGMFIDIGIPEDYARAQVLCQRLREAAHWEATMPRKF